MHQLHLTTPIRHLCLHNFNEQCRQPSWCITWNLPQMKAHPTKFWSPQSYATWWHLLYIKCVLYMIKGLLHLAPCMSLRDGFIHAWYTFYLSLSLSLTVGMWQALSVWTVWPLPIRHMHANLLKVNPESYKVHSDLLKKIVKKMHINCG